MAIEQQRSWKHLHQFTIYIEGDGLNDRSHVTVDGRTLEGVSAVSVYHRAGELPRVTLEIVAGEVTLATPEVHSIHEETHCAD